MAAEGGRGGSAAQKAETAVAGRRDAGISHGEAVNQAVAANVGKAPG